MDKNNLLSHDSDFSTLLTRTITDEVNARNISYKDISKQSGVKLSAVKNMALGNISKVKLDDALKVLFLFGKTIDVSPIAPLKFNKL